MRLRIGNVSIARYVVALAIGACAQDLTPLPTSQPDAAHRADAATGCADNQKIRLYPDADGDGFGDAADPGQLFCGATRGYVVDHTDCADSTALAHPGVTDFYPLAISGPVTTGLKHDYNCDGQETQQWPTTATPSCNGLALNQCHGFFPNGGAWDGSVPPCGAQSIFIEGCEIANQGTMNAYCTVTNPTQKTQACH